MNRFSCLKRKLQTNASKLILPIQAHAAGVAAAMAVRMWIEVIKVRSGGVQLFYNSGNTRM